MIADAREQRDATADGVKQGYAEAQISVGAWKRRGSRSRPWEPEKPGLTGADLEAAVDRLALRFPKQVH